MYRAYKEGCPSGLISAEQLREILGQFFPASGRGGSVPSGQLPEGGGPQSVSGTPGSQYASAVFHMFDMDANGQVL